MASALLMDHYLPGTILFNPQSVFRALYRSDVAWACQRSGPGDPVDYLLDLVETEFVSQFHSAISEKGSMVDHRHQRLISMSSELGRVQSDIICLYCLVRSAQHSQACHHAICDHCAQLFGRPAADAEYRFTLPMCFLCLSSGTLVIDVLPPTMNPTVLAIDGGGVRGGIPLEYLIMIQEHLGPDCRIQDLADLSVGSSSGGLIVLGLMGMGWDVSTCSQVFDRLARRIFHERRRSILSSFSRLLFGRDSILDGFLRWISWILHDSCYDAGVFDASLREAFGESHRIFDVVGPNPPSHLHSKSKFAVIATTIAKETKSYVFGNFNGADWFTREHEHELFRAGSTDGEPLFWEVARATAAAPFYFSPASLHTIGSFQDGGLRDNFAAGIAKRISRRVWPSRTGVARLVSLGTGTVEGPPNHSPHFRHILRDGFLRRGFDALMSNLDTQPKWQELRNQLDDGIKEDFLRLDVPLKGVPCSIDDIDRMDGYRDLVIRQTGSSKMAKETAAALLVSRFYFELDPLPFPLPLWGPSWYHGMIRCKGPTRPILNALQKLCVEDIEFVSDSGLLGKFTGPRDACISCGRYGKSISILVNHPTESFNIYMRFGPGKRWRISGFPSSVEAFIETQKLQHPFGRPDHNRASVAPCAKCDGLRSTRRHGNKRGPCSSLSGSARKRVRTMDTHYGSES
ncbi:acyl transferase/acyl hydrolase/lysophospholipase [Aspergillus ambiguus]|uniref:patatin-like phospholipase family protein n=1 Tax=Aspergillus ambiguus TaxID=176160 RepID=UPI003CCDCB6F